GGYGKDEGVDAPSSAFYFALEGHGARGNEALWGAAFDLVFNYAPPPPAPLAKLEGDKLTEVLATDAKLGIDIVARGLTLTDGVARHIVEFKDGKMLSDPPRFGLQAPKQDAGEGSAKR